MGDGQFAHKTHTENVDFPLSGMEDKCTPNSQWTPRAAFGLGEARAALDKKWKRMAQRKKKGGRKEDEKDDEKDEKKGTRRMAHQGKLEEY
jgi:hypothetical protein